MNKYSLTLTLLFSLLYSCTTKEVNDTDPNLLHDIWALESIEGEKVVLDEDIVNLPVLEIFVKENRVHGNTSCNTLDGKVEIEDNKIIFSDIITTKMACPGDLEMRFLFALDKVNKYKIEKMKLYLYDGEAELLVLNKID